MNEALNTMNIERRVCSAEYNFAEDRRSYSAEFRAQIVFEALTSGTSHADIAQQYAIHAKQVDIWTEQVLTNIKLVFENLGPTLQVVPKLPEKNHAKIGQLIAENDFLTKVLGR